MTVWFSFFSWFLQRNNEMSNELVVEGEDSAPMSEVCSRTQMDAIEELQEEEEQEWTLTVGEGKADSMWNFAEEEAAECYSAGGERGPE